MVGDHSGSRIEARAAIGFGHGQAQQAQFASTTNQRPVQFRAFIELRGLRLDFLADEVDDHFAQETMLFAAFTGGKLPGKIFAW